MSAPIYYTGQRVISAEANNNVESFVLGVYDGILEDINGGLEVNIGFKFKLPGVFATAEAAIKIVKSGDDYLVNGVPIAAAAITVGALTNLIVTAPAVASVLQSQDAAAKRVATRTAGSRNLPYGPPNLQKSHYATSMRNNGVGASQ